MKREHEEILSEYISYLNLQGKDFKNVRVTLKMYFTYLATIDLNYLNVRFAEAQEFQHYLTTLSKEDGSSRYTGASVMNHIGRLVSFYEYLKKKKNIFHNPFSNIHRIRRKKSLPKHILKEDEMNVFLSHLKNFIQADTLTERRQLYKAHVISELMYSTGARINEIKKLKIEDINFYQGTVKLKDSKTGKEREGILNSYAEKVLRIFVEEMREYVLFTKISNWSLLFGADGSMDRWLRRIFRTSCMQLKLKRITSHHFRHAIGFHFLRNGCDIRFIQEILGHEDIASTQVYTLVEKEDLRRVLDSFHPRVLHLKNADSMFENETQQKKLMESSKS